MDSWVNDALTLSLVNGCTKLLYSRTNTINFHFATIYVRLPSKLIVYFKKKLKGKFKQISG